MKRFSAFLERKDRDNKDHLRILAKLFEKAGFEVKDRLDHHEDPYLYIAKPTDHDPIVESLEFGGIRLYTRGKDIISWRPQNKEMAEPFGTAYLLDVRGMFKDLMREGQNEKTAKDLIRYIVEEVLNYFVYSAKVQKDDANQVPDEGLGQVINQRSSTTDYANQVTGNGNNF